MRVLIRVDASRNIGTGHLMRCLALAEALRDRGAAVRFACRGQHGLPAELMCAHGFEALPLLASVGGSGSTAGSDHSGWLGMSWEEDAEQTAAAMAGGVEWLIIDHYGIDWRWQQRLRALTARIMVIDDLADRRHDCDLLLDQNLHRDSAARYLKCVPRRCRLLLGPEYALLRRDFAAARAGVRPRDGAVHRILVCMGGGDGGNFTATALGALARLDTPGVEVEVVIGSQHPALEQIQDLCRMHRFACYVQVQRMAELMARADLSVGACGSASWERCCVGLPAVLVAIADNQVAIGNGLSTRGAAVYLGRSATVDVRALAHAMESLLRQPERLRDMSLRAYALADGLGAQRVAQALVEAA